ncbi:MAG TPA: GNAT family N-acetyltransferase [Kofleriaceae bacterium]|jgi:aminoglycoside 6'-N-acetyltransferase I|nr:GNAT family N-acetyltransferase [Kofleriaceae bacterium]
MAIRLATPEDSRRIGELAHALWPDGSVDEHAAHAAAIARGEPITTLPLVLFVAIDDGAIVAFIEVGLRSHADGCDPSRPVGFIEGWYVEPQLQRRAIGRALMDAAETWSREQGAHELGSDTWLDSEGSQRAHEALGFEVVNRCVHYRKSLSPAGSKA